MASHLFFSHTIILRKQIERMLHPTAGLWRRGAGIVGLPNIGKSTLFNALTCSQQAKTGNFPFCTINANLSKVAVYDERLRTLAKFTGAQKIVDVEIDLADVAGLIEGASKGAGLGNKFLADIRPCNIILHMVRCFESAKDGFDTPTPIQDIAVITNELVLADLDVMEKRFHKNKSKKSTDPELLFCKKALDLLSDGKPMTHMNIKSIEEKKLVHEYGLLSAKPTLYVLNVDDVSLAKGNKYSAMVEQEYGESNTVRVSAAIEEQTSQFTREECLEFLREYGIARPSGELLLRRVYDLLHLQSFFTVGPLMSHGWSVEKGATAKQAAGEIHGDFEEHFLNAKVMQWDALIKCANLASAEMLMTTVDAKYVMQDGDVMIVNHSANRK